MGMGGGPHIEAQRRGAHSDGRRRDCKAVRRLRRRGRHDGGMRKRDGPRLPGDRGQGGGLCDKPARRRARNQGRYDRRAIFRTGGRPDRHGDPLHGHRRPGGLRKPQRRKMRPR